MKHSRLLKPFLCASLLCAVILPLRGETAIKLNAAYALGGVVNPAAEIGVSKHFTIQVEAVASFYKSISLGKKIQGMPLIMGLGFLEMHWFPKERFSGFYCGPSFGYGVYKIQKWNYWGSTKVQYGSSLFLGAVVGYQWQVKRWTFDLFLGGGWQHGLYEGYDTATNTRYDLGQFPEKYNKSAEWMPFKGGLMVGYRF